MNDETRQLVNPILLVGCGKMGIDYGKVLFDKLGFKESDVIAYDRDPQKRIDYVKEVPKAYTVSSMSVALEMGPKTACVLVNSPEHLSVIRELLDAGITNILSEKPLVLTSQLEDLHECPRIREVNLITAYLINFSLAVQYLMEFMRQRGLVVVEARGLWGKNRIDNDRPTAGDWEDEATHLLWLILQLSMLNQRIAYLYVIARFSRVPYVNEAVQGDSARRDPSYEECPIATSWVAIEILAEGRASLATISSSFVSMDQERRLEVVLVPQGPDPRRTSYLARIDFDVGKKDFLRVWDRSTRQHVTKEVCPDSMDKDVKLEHQIAAFLQLTSGGPKDPRLVMLDDALRLINIGKLALASDEKASSAMAYRWSSN